ncbi:uncharacterized protein UMAG_02601 [Mycosarcoma maydis]|uniref:Uncharacterized protein n=1 Tax=Mycosarcoma maydis TaxID=5270 RepID=A0A0D1CRM8_MYCMD|nr:uncharacterized protein UMAG_02601 [Ustilago maydis 521]KIS69253.1 hypothetical protein UMAG_02601 [Ustilago maydis 521]|eukprot:XP_011389002.1 hypothetical protein UMAG_02601 [Ustilago maydis 521]
MKPTDGQTRRKATVNIRDSGSGLEPTRPCSVLSSQCSVLSAQCSVFSGSAPQDIHKSRMEEKRGFWQGSSLKRERWRAVRLDPCRCKVIQDLVGTRTAMRN